jgi:pimeloyl-ACP methyl ester carboxylesterase
MKTRQIATMILIIFAKNIWASAAIDDAIIETKPLSLTRHCTAEENTPPLFKACSYRTTNSKSKKLLFYFHGLNGNVNEWEEERGIPSLLRQQWHDTGVDAPIVVSISFGPAWILFEKNSAPESGLLPYFNQVAFPRVMAWLKQQTPNDFDPNLTLMGVSMGGLNATQVMLKGEQQFQRVALVCPALSNLNPFATKTEIRDYIKQTGANGELVEKTARGTKSFLDTPQSWEVENPFLNVQRLPLRFEQIYLSASQQDDYGFWPGTVQFLTTLRQRLTNTPIQLTWRPLSGPHCVSDIISLAEFLR